MKMPPSDVELTVPTFSVTGGFSGVGRYAPALAGAAVGALASGFAAAAPAGAGGAALGVLPGAAREAPGAACPPQAARISAARLTIATRGTSFRAITIVLPVDRLAPSGNRERGTERLPHRRLWRASNTRVQHGTY